MSPAMKLCGMQGHITAYSTVLACVAYRFWATRGVFSIVYDLETMMFPVDNFNEWVTTSPIGRVYLLLISLRRDTQTWGQMLVRLEQKQHFIDASKDHVPTWVPRAVQNYIEHTETGVPIRALARRQGCHASTVLRQIRRVETLRDDPLVDRMLKTLGADVPPGATPPGPPSDTVPDMAELRTHGMRVLRRLCETGAVLAVAADMEKAVIVRGMAAGGQAGAQTRTGVVDRSIAEAMALKGWIAAPDAGRITRYHITAAGRSALADMMARAESAHAGGDLAAEAQDTSDMPRRIRYSLAESPLAALARRRDRDGSRFLGEDLVRAGERLREDFELADMERSVARDWEGFLGSLRSGIALQPLAGPRGVQLAHGRVIAALRELGPGLSDVTLRCCCFLEGLETAEKTLGWSARSGKIVLRIALMGLKRHYAENADPAGAMIG